MAKKIRARKTMDHRIKLACAKLVEQSSKDWFAYGYRQGWIAALRRNRT